jgi:hypothetical protein
LFPLPSILRYNRGASLPSCHRQKSAQIPAQILWIRQQNGDTCARWGPGRLCTSFLSNASRESLMSSRPKCSAWLGNFTVRVILGFPTWSFGHRIVFIAFVPVAESAARSVVTLPTVAGFDLICSSQQPYRWCCAWSVLGSHNPDETARILEDPPGQILPTCWK